MSTMQKASITELSAKQLVAIVQGTVKKPSDLLAFSPVDAQAEANRRHSNRLAKGRRPNPDLAPIINTGDEPVFEVLTSKSIETLPDLPEPEAVEAEPVVVEVQVEASDVKAMRRGRKPGKNAAINRAAKEKAEALIARCEAVTTRGKPTADARRAKVELATLVKEQLNQDVFGKGLRQAIRAFAKIGHAEEVVAS